MAIAVIGTVFVDIKGFPFDLYIPDGRNAGTVVTVHGGVARNVAEDIGNIELRPKLVSMVDDTAQGTEVLEKLRRHKVNVDHVVQAKDGMGIWLAVFDEGGDLAGSISKRPDFTPLLQEIREHGDEIFADVDSIALEIDLDKEIVKEVLSFAKKYNKKVFTVVGNINIASQRRDLFRDIDCFVCNQLEAGTLFFTDFSNMTPEQLCEDLSERIRDGAIRALVVTMGGQGSVYVSADGEKGVYPANRVAVRDTSGAGDAFFAGVTVGLTYGKSMREAVGIGTRLASSVITISENVCPRFLPAEFGLDIDVEE